MRNRRRFLKFLGAGLTGAYAGGLGPLAVAEGPPASFLPFEPIRPSTRDDLVVPTDGDPRDAVVVEREGLPA